MALSFEPTSLTISFSHSTSPDLVVPNTYEVMTSPQGGADNVNWQSRLFIPTTITTDENASTPRELLQQVMNMMKSTLLLMIGTLKYFCLTFD